MWDQNCSNCGFLNAIAQKQADQSTGPGQMDTSSPVGASPCKTSNMEDKMCIYVHYWSRSPRKESLTVAELLQALFTFLKFIIQ